MYFDPRPKTKREDLYDREKELEEFFEALSYASMIVVSGLRRTGKTSFVNVALAECGCPYAILDLRGLPYNPSHADIIRKLEAAFKQVDKKWLSDLVDALRHIKGVSVLGSELSFEWSKKELDLTELFAKIDRWALEKKKKFLIAFDEVQAIRGDKWTLRFLAHVVDAYHNIVVVVTGSEVGALFDFLGFDQPSSPLYGRHFVQIQMKNFSAEMAKEFLAAGFKQIRMKPSAELLEYAVKELDGVPGWLTLFGVRCREKNSCSKEIVDEVASEAGILARDEVMKLITYSRRYGVILNFLSKMGEATWSQIKSAIEIKEGHSITNHTVSTLIRNLTKMSIITVVNGKYTIADSIVTRGIKEHPLPE
ncbi:MAG: ATP-binding protein [Candidatus Bathyarchaeia archaeon]